MVDTVFIDENACDSAAKAQACMLPPSLLYIQVVDSEEDSDLDTGFYSDDDEAPPPKRKSLLVALRWE